jgi:hypothetical protein
MATHAKFVRLVNYSRKFGEASHIFFKNGIWGMLVSLASPRKTFWQMSANLASPLKTVWRVSASLRSPRKRAWQILTSLVSLPNFRKRPFWQM